MVAVQRAAPEDLLDGFRHIQSAAAEWGGARHDPMRDQSADQVERVPPGQLIQLDVPTIDNPPGVHCNARVWLRQPNRQFLQPGTGAL